MVARVTGPSRILGWLSAFILLPMAVWFEASRARGFAGKGLSNLSLEPLVIAVLGCAVFISWFLLARSGLMPLEGLIKLVILSAAAFAVQRLAPALHE